VGSGEGKGQKHIVWERRGVAFGQDLLDLSTRYVPNAAPVQRSRRGLALERLLLNGFPKSIDPLP
jgi:hypothetical protein